MERDRCRSDCGGGDPGGLLEAGSAEHRSALNRAKGNSALNAACRAEDLGLATSARAPDRSLGLAFLAMLWVVDELLLAEKQLFVCGEYECFRAIDAS